MKIQNLTQKLKYFLTISITLILIGVIVLLSTGIRPSVELMGGTQIEINITSQENADKSLETAVSELKQQGIVVEHAFTENKQLESYIVVRTPNKTVSQNTMQSVANALGIETSSISTASISATVSTKYIVMAVVGLMLTAVAVFIIAWIRYGILSSVSMLLSTLHATLLMFSVVIFTRMLFTTGVLVGIAVATILTIVYNICIFEKHREHVDVVTLDKTKTKVHSIEQAVAFTLPTMLILSAVIWIFSIVGMFSGAIGVIMFMLSLLLATVISIYSSAFFGMSLEAKLQQNAQQIEKQKRSKNNS